MRFFATAFGACLVLAGPVRAQEIDPGAEAKKIAGRWAVFQRLYTPSKEADPVGKLLTDLGHQVEFTDGKLVSRDPKRAGVHLLADLDPTQSPRAIDFRVPGKKEPVYPAIYTREGDGLVIAVGVDGVRPKTFDPGPTRVLLLMSRPPQ
jgi:uncharacterized protein (TIGR03067 family)